MNRIKERAKYFTEESRMARGLAIHQDMQEYSKPMIAAAVTGLAIIIGSEVLLPLAMIYPIETSLGIGIVNGAYGGTPPSDIPSSIGNAVTQIGSLP